MCESIWVCEKNVLHAGGNFVLVHTCIMLMSNLICYWKVVIAEYISRFENCYNYSLLVY